MRISYVKKCNVTPDDVALTHPHPPPPKKIKDLTFDRGSEVRVNKKDLHCCVVPECARRGGLITIAYVHTFTAVSPLPCTDRHGGR
jgi:hypothetical protein